MVTPKVIGLGTLAKSLDHALGYIWAKFGAFMMYYHENIPIAQDCCWNIVHIGDYAS